MTDISEEALSLTDHIITRMEMTTANQEQFRRLMAAAIDEWLDGEPSDGISETRAHTAH